MRSLHELQASFAAGLLDSACDGVLTHLIPAQRMNTRDGLNVYRSNIFQNYRSALGDTYPVIQRLVGTDFFVQAVDAYIRATPSTSGDVHDYGEDFGEFLRTYPGAADLLYLTDMAKLEWAVHRSYHAADAATLDLAQLADIPEEALPALRFELHPSCRLVASPWPTLTIWRANQENADMQALIDLDSGGEQILVIRTDVEVELSSLPAGDYAALAALLSGAALGAAFDAAQTQDETFDLGAFLQHHVLNGTLANIHP